MQNHYNLIHREEEREMMGLCLAEGNWGDSVESAGARAVDPALGSEGEYTKRGGKDEFAKKLYGATEESDKLVVERVESGCAQTRCPPSADRPGVGTTEAVHHITHHRRDEGATS
jgi:hypothetical protein